MIDRERLSNRFPYSPIRIWWADGGRGDRACVRASER